MHNAFITFKGEKISKSTGGLLTIFDLKEKKIDPLDFRYMVLGSNYRKGIEFSWDNLAPAMNSRIKLRNFIADCKKEKLSENKIDNNYKNQFIECISDDLAMPEALAVVWDMMKSDLEKDVKFSTLLDFDRVLGLDLSLNEPKKYIIKTKTNILSNSLTYKVVVEIKKEEAPEEIINLIEKRIRAKQEKNWEESDRIRDKIKNKGYLVEDLKDSYKIKKIQ
jgi:cysteinyl-tRNA synthetase